MNFKLTNVQEGILLSGSGMHCSSGISSEIQGLIDYGYAEGVSGLSTGKHSFGVSNTLGWNYTEKGFDVVLKLLDTALQKQIKKYRNHNDETIYDIMNLLKVMKQHDYKGYIICKSMRWFPSRLRACNNMYMYHPHDGQHGYLINPLLFWINKMQWYLEQVGGLDMHLLQHLNFRFMSAIPHIVDDQFLYRLRDLSDADSKQGVKAIYNIAPTNAERQYKSLHVIDAGTAI